MKFFKNNLKVIIGFVIGVILTGGIVYAVTSASEVIYTTSKNTEIKTVADALNDLYKYKNSSTAQYIGTYTSESAANANNATLTIPSVEKGNYLLLCFRTFVSSPNNYYAVIWGESGITSGKNSDKYDIYSLNGGTYEKIGENAYNLNVDSKTDISITFLAMGSATDYSGYVRAFLIKI